MELNLVEKSFKVKGKIRAAQIGVFSRGGCFTFNSPSVFGSVKMSFDWIKQVVEDEMGGTGYCPMKNDWGKYWEYVVSEKYKRNNCG